ncbi:hypothetical protein GGF32_007399 [Allomyces javanicus]|nr:hypothetical protein GGF32_007399 [Allomyces javanicus]
MPPFILTLIATALLDGEPYRIPLLHLALASPTLFAPCLRVAIKTTGAVRRVRSVWRSPVDDGWPMPSQEAIGYLVTHSEAHTTRYQIMLCLLPRGADRAGLPLRDKLVRGRDRKVEWSRKWSLLPVPIDQLLQYTVDESHIIATVYAVPVRCRSLAIESRKINWRYVPSVPLSLVELRLDEIPAPDVGGGAHGAVFTQLLPHGLRKLVLANVFPSDFKGRVLSALLGRIPLSVKTLELLWPESAGSGPLASKDARLALARSVSRGIHDLNEVLSALPRSTLRKLDLAIVIGKDETDDLLLQLTSSWPNVIESLSLSVNSDHTDRAATDVLSLVTKLPVVMRTLSIKVPHWDVVLCQTLLVMSSFEQLKLDAVDQDLTHLADLFTTLPKSLTHVDLSNLRLGGNTNATQALAQHMPPNLVSLNLTECHLTAADLDHLTKRWPATLRRIDMDSETVI